MGSLAPANGDVGEIAESNVCNLEIMTIFFGRNFDYKILITGFFLVCFLANPGLKVYVLCTEQFPQERNFFAENISVR